MTWLHNGEPYVDSGEYYGFVYKITNITNGKKYIGRKYFTAAGYRQVKGKRKKVRKASDWETYYGSNETLKTEVRELGEHNFVREILYLCKSRSECSYFETREIFAQDALLKEEFYNSWVTAKIHKAHLKNVQLQHK
jgi:hypothetical protein